jgi:CheY-like chemotaxis protein
MTEESLAGMTVLIVDDSSDGREMLEEALRGYGADVTAVDSTEAAIAALESAAVCAGHSHLGHRHAGQRRLRADPAGPSVF